MQGLLYVIVGILGLIFGSFGSVILLRLWEIPSRKTLKGFLFGRSYCPQCNHVLVAKDLIPLLSFFLQKGKCRYCKKKISRLYPFLELTTAGIFIVVFAFFGFSDLLFSSLVALILWLCLLVALYDILHFELHLIATIWIFIFSFCLSIYHWMIWKFFLWTGMVSIVFLAIYFFSQYFCFLKYHERKEWFGLGDVIFSTSIWGLFPLFIDIATPLDGAYILLSFVISCCFFWIFYYTWSRFFSKKKEIWSSMLPFLPSMVISIFLMIFFGEKMLAFLQ